MSDGFIYNDGGRAAAGFKGHTGDCVARAVAIASGRPYAEVYARLADINKGYRGRRRNKRAARSRTAAHGIAVKSKAFRDYMAELGFRWTPTMLIGSGCKVHLCADELPAGRIVVAVSRHYTTMIDGVIHDTYDPRREVHCHRPHNGNGPAELRPGEWMHPEGDLICWIERRCVYGYWTLED